MTTQMTNGEMTHALTVMVNRFNSTKKDMLLDKDAEGFLLDDANELVYFLCKHVTRLTPAMLVLSQELVRYAKDYYEECVQEMCNRRKFYPVETLCAYRDMANANAFLNVDNNAGMCFVLKLKLELLLNANNQAVTHLAPRATELSALLSVECQQYLATSQKG